MRSVDLAPCLVAAFLAIASFGCGDDSETNVGAGGNGSGGGTTASTTSGPSSSVAGTSTSAASGATSIASTSTGSGGDGSGGDGSGGDGSGGDGGAEAVAPRMGEVVVRHYERNEPDDVQVADYAMGFFFEFVVPPVCTRVDEGACWYQHCVSDRDSDLQALDAGTISIDGTTPDLGLELIDESYYRHEADSPLFAAGDSISIAASGADAPSFAVDLVAPAIATVTAPSMGDLVVDRSQDLDLAWTFEGDAEGQGSELRVQILDARGLELHLVRCAFPMEDGAGTIPSAVLEQMPDDDDDPAAMIVEDADELSLDTAGWHIETSVLRTSLSSESASGLAQADIRWE